MERRMSLKNEIRLAGQPHSVGLQMWEHGWKRVVWSFRWRLGVCGRGVFRLVLSAQCSRGQEQSAQAGKENQNALSNASRHVRFQHPFFAS